MRHYILFVILLGSISLKSQSLLNFKEVNADKNNTFTINHGTIKNILSTQQDVFSDEIWIDKNNYKIVFTRLDFLSPNFHIKTSSGEVIYPDRSTFGFYQGRINELSSNVVLSIIDDQVHYTVFLQNENYEIHKDKRGNYIGYRTKIQASDNFISDHLDNEVVVTTRKTKGGNRYGNCLEVYLETDFFTFEKFGSVASTSAWMTTIFANVVSVFNIHNVPLHLSQIFVWNTTDPYSAITNIQGVRNAFINQIQNSYTGRLAHLMSMRPLGGGLANGIGGFCNTYPSYPGPQSISTELQGTNNTFPNYSFNTYLVAHELGHVMGLRHTHACVWENNLIQIDDCGNEFANENNNTPEGYLCYNEDNPILPSSGGTIMSECHLYSSIGINLNLGFGTLPGALLYENFIFSSCNTGSSCNSLPPVNDLCTNAIDLPVNFSCTPNTFSNINATATSGPPSFTCGSPGNPILDVWFKVTVPSSGSLTVETTQFVGGLSNTLMQAYSGSCSNLVSISCDDNSGAGNHARISLSNRTAGEVIYLRVVDSQSNDQGYFNMCAHDESVPCHPDYQALVDFYNNSGGNNWNIKTGWQLGAAGSNCNVCSWYGVQCNTLNRVSIINLAGNNIVASSLSTSLGNLPYLQELILYNNNISGLLPSFLQSLNFLQSIDLGNNNLTGSIPAFITTLPNLKSLYLDHNGLSGMLPYSISNLDLELLYINNNNISGCFPPGFSKFCEIAININDNPLLANGTSMLSYCIDGVGADEDADFHCFDIDDCNDEDADIYFFNLEVCDFKDNDCNELIDDVALPETNNWIGSTGLWTNPENWSLNRVPERCDNVVIQGSDGITVTIPDNTIGVARSVLINSGKNLVISNLADLWIEHGMNIVNNGNFTNNGRLYILYILDDSLFGFDNSGIFTNTPSATTVIQYTGIRGVQNNASGTINNNGVIAVYGDVDSNTEIGIYNEGTIINNGNLNTHYIQGINLLNTPNALLQCNPNSQINLIE